jgi:hypothetical protein
MARRREGPGGVLGLAKNVAIGIVRAHAAPAPTIADSAAPERSAA